MSCRYKCYTLQELVNIKYGKNQKKVQDNEKGKYIVEDVKSPITAKDKVYRLKIKMLLAKYHDIDFVEVI